MKRYYKLETFVACSNLCCQPPVLSDEPTATDTDGCSDPVFFDSESMAPGDWAQEVWVARVNGLPSFAVAGLGRDVDAALGEMKTQCLMDDGEFFRPVGDGTYAFTDDPCFLVVVSLHRINAIRQLGEALTIG